ncbi:MAG: glycosyltransferase family 2 protein [Leptolyngbyaceae cyanobacterium CSU_1_3]|nr:glycosyltransferase family 2 protein [Leptolyngbyaceae cyanobacterium CSU_1_3]
MTDRKIRVSIGVPVYNGENYLEAALDSLLAQTFQDFEIIIADNASTDRTEEICQFYAAKDNRIRYYRHPTNIGATPNFDCLLKYARGEYFKWAAHDDVHAPTYLEKCVAVLDRNPKVILCYPWTQFIDEKGDAYPRNYEFDGKLRLNSDQPHERFHDIACTFQECFQLFGLIRTSVLKQPSVGPYGNYSHADGVYLARLALAGQFHEIPEQLFLSRQHSQQSCKVYAAENTDYDYFEYTAWCDPSKAGKFILPHWTIFSEYCSAIFRSQVSFTEKLACLSTLRVWLRTYWTHMVRDIFGATNYYFYSLKQRSQQPISQTDS